MLAAVGNKPREIYTAILYLPVDYNYEVNINDSDFEALIAFPLMSV
jgi:hypothetical protein